eukprot:589468-Prymnesium_polylepis.2
MTAAAVCGVRRGTSSLSMCTTRNLKSSNLRQYAVPARVGGILNHVVCAYTWAAAPNPPAPDANHTPMVLMTIPLCRGLSLPASHDASENLRWRYRMRSGHEEYTWHCSFQVEANAPQDDLCQEYRKPEEDEEEIHAVLAAQGSETDQSGCACKRSRFGSQRRYGSLSESIGCTSLPRELPRFLGRDNNQRGQIARLDHEHARVDKDQCQLDK